MVMSISDTRRYVVVVVVRIDVRFHQSEPLVFFHQWSMVDQIKNHLFRWCSAAAADVEDAVGYCGMRHHDGSISMEWYGREYSHHAVAGDAVVLVSSWIYFSKRIALLDAIYLYIYIYSGYGIQNTISSFSLSCSVKLLTWDSFVTVVFTS